MSAIPSSSSQLNVNGTSSAQNKTKELFNSALQSRNPNNNYIAHLKIWEDVPSDPAADGTVNGSTKKARYLILAVQKDTGRVTINKAKRNANGSFSIGKDWDLNTLREVHVHQPDIFSITLTRPYQWQTQQPREQHLFLQSLVKVYRKYTQEDGPKLVGIDVPSTSTTSSVAVPDSGNLSDRPSSGNKSETVAVGNVNSQSNGTSVTSSPPRQPPAPAASSSSQITSAQPYSIPGASSAILNLSPRKTAPELSISPVRTSPVPDAPMLTRERSGSQSSSGTGKATSLRSLREAMNPSPLSKTVRLPPESRSFEGVAKPASNVVLERPQPTKQHSADSLTVPRLPQTRKGSADNLSIRSGSSGGGGGGGDARARLSSIEPIRGGAAYERMLLAGTGLSGVNEVDDDAEEEEDPYGGAVIGETEVPTNTLIASKRATLGRPNIARIDVSDKIRTKDKPATNGIGEEEDENSTLVAVEEMLEGFEWRNAGGRGYGTSSGKGTADMIEARLLDELSALESANIHAIIESDDRVALVVQHMEEALSQLDMMDSMIAGFKVQLNSRADDISHIESQNRGLQVQTSNQRTLMAEIENLINTINVDETAVHTLSAGRLESADGISQLETAVASLYKSMLQARRDGDGGGADMAAAAERLADHEAISARFCKRVLDYLNVTFNVESQRLLSDPARQKALQPPQPTLPDHSPMEDVLGQYCGLLLYMKETSSDSFSRVSAAYFASVSECYKKEMQGFFGAYRSQLRKASEEDVMESSFAPPGSSAASSAIRSGTIRRVGRDRNARGARVKGEITGQEGLQRILSSVLPILIREQGFISDFLHINDNNITFADYMDLEPYFRRRAAGMFGASVTGAGPLREMKGALDLIFGFLAPELQAFCDDALSKDKMCIIGLLATLDRAIVETQEANCESLHKILSKLHLRLASQLERFVQEQIKGIAATKLTVKKRKGVVNFIRVFPVFVERVEAQLVHAEHLNIRGAVDGYYTRICVSMFDALQTISRFEGPLSQSAEKDKDEDKGQLNHLVILIENMGYFISEINKILRRSSASSNATSTTHDSASLTELVKRAESINNDSMANYTTFVLRRPLAKMMDFGDGIDSLLRSTPATEVSLHSAYSKSTFKKLVRDHTPKDTRKNVEALSKRVAKHFGDEDESMPLAPSLEQKQNTSANQEDVNAEQEVLIKVWQSCQEGYVKEFQRLTRIGKDCYPDQNAGSELLGVQDLRKLFQGMAPKRR